jgi:hypothetical protein
LVAAEAASFDIRVSSPGSHHGPHFKFRIMLINNISVLKVLTSATLSEILEKGGIGYYKADENRVIRTRYLLCVSNGGFPAKENGGLNWSVSHGDGFLLGKISGASRMRDGRLFIRLRRYAPVRISASWDGSQNPVRYVSKEGIEARRGEQLEDLAWIKMPLEIGGDSSEPLPELDASAEIAPLTIDQAKIGLSMTFGVDPSQIEIIIKG